MVRSEEVIVVTNSCASFGLAERIYSLQKYSRNFVHSAADGCFEIPRRYANAPLKKPGLSPISLKYLLPIVSTFCSPSVEVNVMSFLASSTFSSMILIPFSDQTYFLMSW
ncbi:MAG: hypothetical protein LBQ23_02220 [Puniceicoccales bacterium]|jgi:hypothetical protein|nr:hypothetical protein [Puniceicoccales bacterium]